MGKITNQCANTLKLGPHRERRLVELRRSASLNLMNTPVWGRSRDCRCTLTTPIPDRTNPGPNGGIADSLDEAKGSVPRGDGGTFFTARLVGTDHSGAYRILPDRASKRDSLSPGKSPLQTRGSLFSRNRPPSLVLVPLANSVRFQRLAQSRLGRTFL